MACSYQPGDSFGPTVAQQLERDPFGASSILFAPPSLTGAFTGVVIKQATVMLVLHTSTAKGKVYLRLWVRSTSGQCLCI